MSTPNFVLFVDDNPDILETVLLMVEEKYPHTSTATSVEEAKELLKVKTYACIVLDIDINGTNGAEIVRFIRDTKPMSNHLSPIVIMSGFVNEDFRTKFNSKVEGIISKPFEADDLINIITMAIRKKVPSRKIQFEINGVTQETAVFDPKINAPFPIEKIDHLVQKSLKKLKEKNPLKQSLKQIKESSLHIMMKRTGMIINIAGVLAKSFGWDSPQTLEKFVYAAYLHDISLGNDPRYGLITFRPDFESNKEFFDDEKKLLLYHSIGSSKLLKSIGNIHPDVATMIEDHHEKGSGQGFPRGIDHKTISGQSTVFILAHDFTNFVLENENWSFSKFSLFYTRQAEGPQFKKAMRALEEAL